MLRLANGFAKGTSGVRTGAAGARRRRAQRRRDAARAHARLRRPERSRPARRPRLRHLRRHAPGRQGGHLADQQQLVRHRPRGARAGRRRAPARRAARWPPRSTGRPSRPTPRRCTRPSPLARPYPGIVRRSARMRELLDGLVPVAAGLGAQPAGPAHVPQCRRHPRRGRRRPRVRLLAARDRAQRRAREPARRRSARRSSSRCRTTRRCRSPLRSISRASRSCRRISSAQERSVKLLQAPLTGLGTGLQEAEAESNECALSELAWAAPGAHGRGALARAPGLHRDRLDACSPRASRTASRWRPLAARRLSEEVAVAEELLALGLVVAAQAVDVRGCAPLGRGTARAHAQVRERYAFVAAGRLDRPGPRRRRRARALGRARCRRLTRSRCGRGSPGWRETGRLVEIGETLDPAAGLAARLVAHDREPVRVAHVRGSDAAARRQPAAEPRADRRGARRRPRATLGARLQAALADAARRRRSSATAPARSSSSTTPTSRSCRSRASSSTRAGRTSRPAASSRAIPRRASATGRSRACGRSAAARALVGIAPNHHLAVAAPRRARARRAPADRRHDRQPPGAAASPPASTWRAARTSCASPGRCSASPSRSCAARSVPLEVPAGCEIVLEGELDLDATVEEGPVSEFHGGYEHYGRAATATFQRLTRRRDAIYQAVLPGFHPEHALIGGVAIAAGLERRLRALVPAVHAVAVPESGAGRLAAVVALGAARGRRGARRRAGRPRGRQPRQARDGRGRRRRPLGRRGSGARGRDARALRPRPARAAGHARRPRRAARARRADRQARDRRHAQRRAIAPTGRPRSRAP